MAHSLELRSPLLDHRVVELGLALPETLKFRGREGKVAFRRAFADELPPQVASRGKSGFGVPLARWFRTDLRPLAADLLLDERARSRGWFRADTDQAAAGRAHRRARRPRSRPLDALHARALAADARRGGGARGRARHHAVTRRIAYPALAFVCAVPRLAILLHERGAITASFTEKSDTFALTFVQHGTFGFLAGEPSAYTQPLYGWFLVPVYWAVGRSWESIGISQLVLSIVTAWLVYEIGRRVLGARWGFVAAAIATLNPYLAWHDMHVNREIVDQVCAAALVLLTLIVAERPSKKLAALLGVVTGLAMLGNTRLVFLPILCAGYLVWRLPRVRLTAWIAALVLGGAAVAVAPWIVRNKVQLGCWTITTDGRAHVEGEQPPDVRAALLRAVDRQRQPLVAAAEAAEPGHAGGGVGLSPEGPARRRVPRLSERVRRDELLRARDVPVLAAPSREQGEADARVGEAALAADGDRDERPQRRRDATSTSAGASPSPRT